MRCSNHFVSPMAYLFATCGKPALLLLIGGLILTLSLLSKEGIAAESCSGTVVDINNRIFYAGETATCVATISINMGPTVTIDDYADVSLQAPIITFNPPFQVVYGGILSAGPPPDYSPLNDTGITWAGNFYFINNDTCTSNISSPQDCHQGRDFTHNDDSDGHAGFSYTKLSNAGAELPASATSWTCVRDNVTGLTWEVKTDDGGIHDKDNTYRWGGKTALGDGTWGTYYSDWNSLVNGSNNERLCGFSDWRVPIRKELENLVSLEHFDLTIDTDYFPNTYSSHFWSASPYANTSDSAWRVDFSEGSFIIYSNYRDSGLRVRLVRGGE